MIDHLFKILIAVSLILTIEQFGYVRGYDKASEKPASDKIWIDNNYISLDSTIVCSPIYSEDLTIIGNWINVDHGTALIECIDTDDYTWQEFRDSWLMAFKEGLK